MKTTNTYTNEFKLSVIKEVTDGLITKDEARRRYNIKGKSAILDWMRKFDVSKSNIMSTKRIVQADSRSLELELENKRLKEELAMEQLRVRALNIMIDIAENQLNVPIRKKSGTKQ
jgi:transposase-like protein